jgi:hypothetical protein
MAFILCALPMAGRAAPENACAHLAYLVDAAPSGPVFLASYPTTGPGPLANTAFLYDNAAAAIALVGCGDKARAERIGQAILISLDNDRFWHDGRLRNAYAAGAAQKPAKLSGWWDKTQNRWLEDRYQVGSDNGNMAWAMLALLALDHKDAAAKIGDWVAASRDQRGAGGFTGGTLGHEPTPESRSWKSTEHNTDLTAAFTVLADRTGNTKWRDLAGHARHFVEAMWRADCACFAAGTTEDGVTLNPTLSLDAQVWPLLALPGAKDRYSAILATIDKRLATQGGYSYGEAKDGIWTEGTAQMALLQGNPSLQAVIESQRSPDGGYYATSAAQLPTGYGLESDPAKPRLYFRLPHLGAAAWAALAETGFNPFSLGKE